MNLKIRTKVLGIMVLLCSVLLLGCIKANAASESPNTTTEIGANEDVNELFKYIHSKPIELYAKCYLNVRDFPNTENSEVVKVIAPNTKVTEIAEYDGWSKVIIGDSNECFYIWNEYLSKDKVKVEKVEIVSGNKKYLGNFTLTAYCSCSKCCGKWAGGNTASGTRPTPGRTVAMGGVPFGTKLLINGHVYTVEDRGTSYGHIDIFFGSHSSALNFGRKSADVYLIN